MKHGNLKRQLIGLGQRRFKNLGRYHLSLILVAINNRLACTESAASRGNNDRWRSLRRFKYRSLAAP